MNDAENESGSYFLNTYILFIITKVCKNIHSAYTINKWINYENKAIKYFSRIFVWNGSYEQELRFIQLISWK